jgi:tetratricopeptide (TPR) repeat protein
VNDPAGGGAGRVSADGAGSVAIGGDNSGTVITGDGNRVVSLGALPLVGEVPPTPGPVGVPGVGVFVGRGDELARMHAVLSQGGLGVCVVHGLGGIGKTTLAAAYALEHAGEYTQVVWVVADSVAALNTGLGAFATALEPQLSGALEVEGLQERAVGWLASHERWLLVLDNVNDPLLVRDLKARIGDGRVVTTSRRATGWAGIAEPLAVGVLEPGSARDLVAATLGPGRARLLAGVGSLCERLGFLPLALEQAAAYMAQNSVGAREYLALLETDAAAIYGQGAEGTPAARTLARIWAVSLDALADDALCGRVLRVLAWLSPDGVPRRLLSDLSGGAEVVRAVGRLCAYSMIWQDEAGTITVHRMVQTVARTAHVGDPHREPIQIEWARDEAARLLYRATPGEPRDPAHWPAWRELTVQVAAFIGHTAPHTDTVEAAYLLTRTADFLNRQGCPPHTITYLRRAIATFERVLGPEHPDTLTARDNLVRAYSLRGDYLRAVELGERTLADRERVLGPEHPDTLTSRNRLAIDYFGLGDYARAVEIFDRTLADRERVLGPEHPDTLQARSNLAVGYYGLGDYARAVELDERTLADRERVLGPEHPDTLTSRNNLAADFCGLGDYARAVELDEHTLADRERVLGPEHPDTLTSRNKLAMAHYAAGDIGRAVGLLERTLADRGRVLGPEHPDTLTSRNNLAEARSTAQRTAGAP